MQTIYLDISNKGVIPTIYAKQGDVGRKFQVALTDKGVPYYPTAGSAFSVWYSGASGEGNYTDIGDKSAFSLTGNKVTVEMVSQMLLNDGDGFLALVLNDADGNQISTWNIPYICEFVPGADSEEAKNYYTAFSEAVKNLPYPDDSLSVPGKAADAAAVGNALAKKAPSGYGLGAEAKLLTSADDLNTIKANGWYSWYYGSKPQNVPSMPETTYMTLMRVWSQTDASDGSCYQEIVDVSDSSYRGTRVQRTMYGSIVYEWEWENPPMVLGIEYRTTERYNGKPVYTMLFDCGALPNATSKEIAHGISNCIPISYYGSISNQVAINSYPRIDVTFGYTKLIVESKTDQSAFNLHIALKYTKN